MRTGNPSDADDHEQEEEQDRADDGADRLDAEPVGHPQVARVAGEGEALLGRSGERRARMPETASRQAGGERAEGPFEERLLELELLEVLGLHRPELGQAGLDRVDRRAAGETDDDEQDAAGRERGDDDREDGHRR